MGPIDDAMKKWFEENPHKKSAATKKKERDEKLTDPEVKALLEKDKKKPRKRKYIERYGQRRPVSADRAFSKEDDKYDEGPPDAFSKEDEKYES